MSEPKFFNAKQLADRWGVSESKVQKMTKTGEISSMRVGRTIRIPLKAVLSFEDENTRRPGEPRWAS